MDPGGQEVGGLWVEGERAASVIARATRTSVKGPRSC